ncbi:MAG: Uma2 family endonuclease [Xenococcaceae cyanobacterium MO_207.B15]|nr:Uma2 family endonuclease [Xenococcaceae cyanobacterium MO_207.B15]
MTMQVTTKTYYSPEEYLELETKAEYRSEYHDGQIIPMAGGKPNHNKISLNLSSALNFAFRGTSYDVFMSDLRLWIPNCRLYTYPDVMVVDTPLVFAENRQDTIVNPLMIAEILSDSTEKYDRGDKFRMYRTIPSFKEYLLISQKAMQVEKFSKNDSNQWVLSEYAGKSATITFDSFEFEISLDDLYERVELST